MNSTWTNRSLHLSPWSYQNNRSWEQSTGNHSVFAIKLFILRLLTSLVTMKILSGIRLWEHQMSRYFRIKRLTAKEPSIPMTLEIACKLHKDKDTHMMMTLSRPLLPLEGVNYTPVFVNIIHLHTVFFSTMVPSAIASLVLPSPLLYYVMYSVLSMSHVSSYHTEYNYWEVELTPE